MLGAGVILPHGSGGGCIYNGPFVNYTVPFRAFAFAEALEGTEPADRFDYVPRCLSRDLNTYIAETYCNQTDVDSLIYNSATMADFQDTMSGTPGTYAMGVHGGGHFTLGVCHLASPYPLRYPSFKYEHETDKEISSP